MSISLATPYAASRLRNTLGSRAAIKFVITFIFTILVLSSPIVVFINPVVVVAATMSNLNKVDSSNYHSTPPLAETHSSEASSSTSTPTPATAPSTLSQNGDFTTQAALGSLTARPTNNIVNTNSFYDVVFLAASSGVIKTIEVTFPAGTIIPIGAFFNEAEGIGPGTVSKSGQTITYTVNSAVNVPAGTKIRLEFANINNPLQVSSNFKVTVTTRNAANAIIDGPSESAAYTIKQIGTNAIADNSITSTKPNEGFMKRVTLQDNAAGNARGWDPNGVTTDFTISEPDVSGSHASYVSLFVFAGPDCRTLGIFPGEFDMACVAAPTNGAQLHYLVENLPQHIIN